MKLNIFYVFTGHLYCCWLIAKLCPIVCDPMDCSLLCSSVCGISEARILECIAISLFRGTSWLRDQTQISCIGRWILYCQATREAQSLVYLWTNICESPLLIFFFLKDLFGCCSILVVRCGHLQDEACGLSCPGAYGNLSSQTRNQTCIPWIARWILNHWIISPAHF